MLGKVGELLVWWHILTGCGRLLINCSGGKSHLRSEEHMTGREAILQNTVVEGGFCQTNWSTFCKSSIEHFIIFWFSRFVSISEQVRGKSSSGVVNFYQNIFGQQTIISKGGPPHSDFQGMSILRHGQLGLAIFSKAATDQGKFTPRVHRVFTL